RSQDFRRLEIRWDKNPRFETFARRLRCDGVREVSCRRTRNCIESEAARLCQCHSDHAILETQRGEAHGIVLDAQPPGAKFPAQMGGAQKWREAHRKIGVVVL